MTSLHLELEILVLYLGKDHIKINKKQVEGKETKAKQRIFTNNILQ